MFKTIAQKSVILEFCLPFLSAAAICVLLLNIVIGNRQTIKAEPVMDFAHQIDNQSRWIENSPLVIPAAAFYNWGPPGPPVPYGAFANSDGYITVDETQIDAIACWIAPVYLPDGAEISSFTTYVYNQVQIIDFSVNLRRKFISDTNNAELLSQANITGQEIYIQEITGTAVISTVATIDNNTYSYFVDTCLRENHRLYAVEIGFRQNTYLPVVMKDYCPFWWECEPNDTQEQAHGPLVSGDTYYGNPDDHGTAQDSDYFFIELPGAGTITVTVTNFDIPGQVQVYKDGISQELIKKDETDFIKGNLDFNLPVDSGGKYYIRVVSRDDHQIGNGNYSLTVTFD
jgi:hypothetical protein